MFLSDLERRANLNQLSRSDTRAIPCGGVPRPLILDQLRPKREGSALGWFGRMNAAAMLEEEMTLRAARLAQPEQVRRAVHVLRFEFRRGQTEELRRVFEIALGQVDVAFLVTAVDTAGLTFEVSIRARAHSLPSVYPVPGD